MTCTIAASYGPKGSVNSSKWSDLLAEEALVGYDMVWCDVMWWFVPGTLHKVSIRCSYKCRYRVDTVITLLYILTHR